MSDGRDWVKPFSDHVYTSLPDRPPIYWQHPLIQHFELPDQWPVDWNVASVRDKSFTIFLELFDPPADLCGIVHQLVPLRFVVESIVDEIHLDDSDAMAKLDQFIECVTDYISLAPTCVRKKMQANKLPAISKLGTWRFHFHCSQVLRAKIEEAVNFKMLRKNQMHRIVSVAKIRYLRDGSIDPIYESLAVPMHISLRRRQSQKKKELEKRYANSSDKEDKKKLKHIVYDEVIACEHCLHFGHWLVDDWNGLDHITLATQLRKKMRSITFSHRAKQMRKKKLGEEHKQTKGNTSEQELIEKLEPSIIAVFRLLSTFGSYHPHRGGMQKRKKFRLPKKSRFGRLLPQGQYEEFLEKERTSRSESIDIDEALNILDGLFDDASVEACLKRNYGMRPKVSSECGESEDDYRSGNTVDIPASWLVSPYRNSIKQHVQAESLIMNLEPPAWSSTCLRIESIKHYLSLANDAAPDLTLLAHMALHTGMNERALRSLRIGRPSILGELFKPFDIAPERYDELCKEADAVWGDIFFNPETNSYIYLMAREACAYFDDASPDFIQGCETSSRVVHIYLPLGLAARKDAWIKCLKMKFETLGPKDSNHWPCASEDNTLEDGL